MAKRATAVNRPPWALGQWDAAPGSVVELAAALRAGTVPLPEYLNALEAHFRAREPALLAFVPEEGRFERLQREATMLLARFPNPDDRPPLFGLPIGVKDIFHVDGFATRAGSRLPLELLQGPEAAAVTVLKTAGALILGKTVTTEFAYFGPGPTRNPWHPDHTPGGSSSGSAAAVGAGLAPLALGTQTIGSINRPAAFCGAVGYKPSYGRISAAGVIPLAPSLDHVGLLAADVGAVGLAAPLLTGDWAEPATHRPVLGVPAGPYLARAMPEGLAHFWDVVERLAGGGWTIRSVRAMTDFEAIYQRHNLLVAAEAAGVHADWFDRYGDLYHPNTVALIRRGQTVTPEEAAAARHGREQLRQELTELMDSHGLDLWLAPAAPGPAPIGRTSTGDPVMNLPWTHSGLPSLSLPAGRSEKGLPLGLQLIARWWADEALVAWGESLAPTVAGPVSPGLPVHNRSEQE